MRILNANKALSWLKVVEKSNVECRAKVPHEQAINRLQRIHSTRYCVLKDEAMRPKVLIGRTRV